MKHEETGDTLDADWTESPFSEGEYAQDENPMLGEMPNHPLHVKVVGTASQTVAAEFAAWTNVGIPVAGVGQPAQLCPHKYHREKAKFVVNWGNLDTGAEQAIVPATAGFIFLGNVANGYLTGFSAELATADANAITFTVANTGGGLPNPQYILPAGQTSINVTFPVPIYVGTSTTPRINYTATATAAGTISLFGTMNPQLYIANKQAPLTSGALQNVFFIQPGQMIPDYEGQQEVWAICSQAGVEINVVDMTYGTVQ